MTKSCGHLTSLGRANKRMVNLLFSLILLVHFFFKLAQGQGPGLETNKYLNVSENQPPGTVVGFVSELPSYTYSTDDTNFLTNFNLDQNTGRITTKVSIDRETLNLVGNQFSLLVIARGAGNNHPVEVHIKIIDVNDNVPTFPQQSSKLDIRENSNIGSTFRIDTATDRDYGSNSEVNTYEIISGQNGPFDLVFNPELYGPILFLKTTGNLDRETISSYTLVIKASDNGSPVLSGSTTLSISITDENDNAPAFEFSNYFIEVNETDPIGTVLKRVLATDKDIGANQQVIYEFETPADQFTISNTTGEIRTAAQPIECQGQCDLIVVARDQGRPPYSGRTFVHITVIDTNNHDPEIFVKYVPLDSTEFSRVNENAVNGEKVAGITVTDKDDGINGETNASIIAGNELNHFLLQAFDSKNYLLFVNGDQVLDMHRHQVYNLTLQAKDKGTPPRTAVKQIVIYVNDINTFAPVFVNKTINIEISELTEVGSFIASMDARDQDTGLYAKLTYRIESGNNPDWFHINPETGLVTTKSQLHYEVANSFRMNISVHDGALKPDYAELRITIRDENDMAPRFSQNIFYESLEENQGSVSPVVSASAEDNDSGLNGSLVYSFHPYVEYMYPSTFHLNTASGAVTTMKGLDREEISNFTIIIIANDKGPAPLTSTATVILVVTDVNDNPPLFYPTLYYVKVIEGQGQGVEVVKVTATDLDLGENADIFYSFSVSSPKFAINAATGVITTTDMLKKDQTSVYNLIVLAKDKFNKYTATATVRVSVLSVSDSLPIFEKANYSFEITEDPSTSVNPIYVGQQVGTVTASGIGSAAISYFITGGDPKSIFSINAASGAIVRSKAVDRENSARFVLKVVATGSGKFVETSVVIVVKDVNDNAPEFEFPSIEVDLLENRPVGHYITVISASDADEKGPNSLVTYSLVTDHNAMFGIKSDTGLLYLNKQMEMLDADYVTLSVVAMDAGSPSFSATQQVTITVKDINNNTPKFLQSSVEKSLVENHPVNSRFLLLNAVDSDRGENGRLTYNITRGNEDRVFGIFPDGYLFIAKALDREAKDIYKLSVVARDNGEPSRSAEFNITIHITDFNDNKPVFINATYLFTLQENRRVGSYIGQVMATDADIGRNSDLTYYFRDHQKDFKIDPQTGEIRSLRVFDREQLAKIDYTLETDVVVRDNGLNQLNDTATIRVRILDVNDNPPTFKQSVYTTSIFENAPMYSNVTNVKAEDLDSGVNSVITYAIIGGNGNGTFTINNFNGQIILNTSQLDREKVDFYELDILAVDSGEVQYNATCKVLVTIKDINDNLPLFPQSQMDSSVREDEKPGFLVADFTATDIDQGVNAVITYSLSGVDNDGMFGIDVHTGKIYLQKKLDFEKKSFYRMNVTATDHGLPPLAYPILFTINVKDVNDNSPVFQNEPLSCHIAESLTGSVCTIRASDVDSDKNGEVTYEIKHQDPPGDQFKIVKVSGQIYTDKELDREVASEFKLRVIAVDQAIDVSQRLTTETVVTITVDDVNDNDPTITSFTAIAIPQATPANTYITTVVAKDKDKDSNGKVALNFPPNSGNYFSMESGSGRFLLSRQLPENPVKYPVTIVANDYGSPSQRTIMFPVTVLVTNNNNQGPVFQNASYSGTLRENVQNADIFTVQATSRFSSNVEYYITNITRRDNGLQAERIFNVDKETGRLTSNGPLDRETMGGEFDIEIYAIDTQGSTPRTSIIVAKVTLQDVNDTPPKFSSSFYIVDVDENVRTGFPITKLTVYDEDTIGTMSLSLVNPPDSNLQIKPDGTIVTTGPLDRETIPQYTLNVTANDGTQTSFCVVRINVRAYNDNPPKFTEPFYSFDISEDTAVGTTVGSVLANDPDLGSNGLVTYSLVSGWGNDTFALDPVKGTFTLLRVLDFEENPLYTVQVVGKDGGMDPAQESTVLVFFNVKDANDHSPEFERPNYSASVLENVAVGSTVIQVRATDIDSGDNGMVTYNVTGGDHKRQFQIDLYTGVITVASRLDREVTPAYTLTVTATDRGGPQMKSSTVQVLVTLQDVNDCIPEFKSPAVIGVTENTNLTTVVHTVVVHDCDAGANADLTFSIASKSGPVSPFTIGTSDGRLRVNTNLDRETTQNYTMVVTVRDHGNPPLSSTQDLVVNIEDENDHSPVFSQTTYLARVSEDVAINVGQILLKVTATDQDVGVNGMVRYFVLSGDENQDFSLDQSSGALRVQKKLDYERVSSYKLFVRAEDRGSIVRFAAATVSITVDDVNDNEPVFLDSPYVKYVRENMDRPVFVLQVSAKDADSAPFNQLQYKIQSGDLSLFNISQTTGQIMALQSLDRERALSYVLTVVATDSGNGRGNTGTCTVTIFVEDVNDNPPVFDGTSSYVARVSENLPQNATVVTVHASDLDEGVNKQIVYSLKDTMNGKFVIFPNTGRIATQAVLDREQVPDYTLEVVAMDTSLLPLSSTTTVRVYVEDVNDNSPLFGQQNYSRTLALPVNTGAFIVGVTATDADIGNNRLLRYSLALPDAGNFNIDNKTGVITAKQTLSAGTYNMNVIASDMAIQPLSATAQVTVTVSSSSSVTPPTFNTIATGINVTENVSSNQTVTMVTAQSSNGATINYAIAGGNINDAFGIERSTGRIYSAGTIDYELLQEYHLWIEARQDGNTPATAFAKVMIKIEDTNDNSPVFSSTQYDIDVMENRGFGTSIYTVSATDADSGVNGNINYILSGTDAQYFKVTSSGQIRTYTTIDREKVDKYSFLVIATDQGNPARSSTTSVRITVLDENDENPSFAEHFRVKIPENMPVGSFVIRVTSTDNDIGENAVATYSLPNSTNGMFAIDGPSGNITLLKPLDAETVSTYTLRVRATDSAHDVLGNVQVDIADVNDNSPVFQPPYSFSFSEMMPVGSQIGYLKASDADISSPNNLSYFSLKLSSSYFNLNSTSGLLTSREVLTFDPTYDLTEPPNRHKLIVIVQDLGTPVRSSEQLIFINVMDFNDHAPVFDQPRYRSAVPESTAIGNSIITVKARDELDYGVNAQLEYYIQSGNGTGLFSIDRVSGIVSVNSSLSGNKNREYQIVVKAQDKGATPLSAVVPVNLVVTDTNLYNPQFVAPVSRQISIPENKTVGSLIETFQARDNDLGLNGEVEYYISQGNGDDLFELHPSSGDLRVKNKLDYEKKKDYQLVITAKDKGLIPLVTPIDYLVKLEDVNDNDPLFALSMDLAYVEENSPRGKSVYQAKAVDADTGGNAYIEYAIVEPVNQNTFQIDSTTGIITTKGDLDYETKQRYTLTIMASNRDAIHKSTMTLDINVEGVNEDVPHFTQDVYHFTISESAVVSTSVGRVRAEDTDAGLDGVVNYFLIGDSNTKGFRVDPRNGDILVSGKPDYESSPKITLKVLAKNWGSVKGNDTDTCSVEIMVQDANDPPRFTQTIYQAYIPEDTKSADVTITTVSATDSDFDIADKKFSYRILAGNVGGMFKIGANSGVISTTSAVNLDRETVAIYNLTVGAVDTGSPPETGSATVQVNIQDINDNGPYFVEFTAGVLENQPPSFLVTTLTQYTRDADSPSNQGPYTYSTKPGGDNAYNFFTIAPNGDVKTKKMLDRESLDNQFTIPVLVSDAGQMTSTLTFKVVVQDVNDVPPKPRFFYLYLSMYEGLLPTNAVADVRPLDDDEVGTYSCTFDGNSNADIFTIPSACNLMINGQPNEAEYHLKISGGDGVNGAVTYDVNVAVNKFSNNTLEHSTIMHIVDVTPKDFMKSYYTKFVAALKSNLEPQDKVDIIGLTGLESEGVLIYMVISNEIDKDLYNKEEAIGKLQNSKAFIESEIQKFIASLDYTGCRSNYCKNNGVCAGHITVQEANHIADSDFFVFSNPAFQQEYYCKCVPEFTGPDCSQPASPCGDIFCQNGGVCNSSLNKPVCSCPLTWTGSKCDQDVNECRTPGFCKNGGTCMNTIGGFICKCAEGYFGKQCQDGDNFCKSSPCKNGKCLNQPDKFVCLCNYGFYGDTCDSSSLGFYESSYMEYLSIKSLSSIMVDFATKSSRSLLLYQYANTESAQFLALEIIRDMVVFSYRAAGASQPLRLSVTKDTSTGGWFRVRITVNSEFQTVRMWVDNCPEDRVACDECQTGSSCYNMSSAAHPWSASGSHTLMIGGVQSIQTILNRTGQVSTHDFIGCLKSVSINGENLLNLKSLRENGIKQTCPRTSATDVCQGFSCQNGGQCVPEWTGPVCRCSPAFMGSRCETALKPIGVGPDTFITVRMREGARRDALLDSDGNRRRRALTTSSVKIRFRTMAKNGLLLYANTFAGRRLCVLSVFDGKLKFTVTQYGGSKSITVDDVSVSDGKWRNATVVLNGGEVNLSLDGSSSKSPIDMFAFTSPDVETLTLGGAPSTITVENQNLKDFPGCLSAFELDGQQLPLIGETANYVITAPESIDNGCSDLCTNACDGECTIQGEAIACAPKADAPLTVGIIVVIVFFSVISVVIVILLVVFRKRGAQCLKGTKAARQNGSLGKGANSSGHSNQDSGYGENNIDQLIIRNHINQELASSGYQRHMNGHLVQPDIINSEIGRTPMPLDLEDGTVIIDNASDVTHLRDLNSEMPVLYDLDNASSIAPSDIDIVDHYRHFHDNGGRQRRKNKAHSDHSHHSKHSSKHVSQSNHSNHSHHSHGVARDSPNISSVPFMNNLARDSPVSRNSPINQLSRTSPNVRQSPFTHVNMVRGHNMPVTDLNGGSRTTSEHSVASHRSKASNSTPNKPRRQMLPNGQPNGNLLNPNYENSKFLTKEEVDRLNARPRQSPASLMEAFSTSSENNTRQMKKPLKHYQDTNVLLEPPESSSDGSANDSFTCSEFEYENDKPRNDFDAKIFSKIKEENEHEDGAYHNKNFKSDGLDSGGNSFSSTERPPEENTLGQSTGKSVSNPFSWDDLLNWGPKFEKLVGVFTDIAMLPDAESADFSEVEGKSTDREEYV